MSAPTIQPPIAAPLPPAPASPAPAGLPTHTTGPPFAGALPSLTALRWAAAFTVFGLHVTGLGHVGGQPRRIAEWAVGAGAVGVSFFFILSGFVLAWSARPHDSVTGFWRRRIARIYPLHLVTAALAVAVALVIAPGTRIFGPDAVANLLLLNSWHRDWWQSLNPVSWSLTCEAFFYAVFPLFFPLLRRAGTGVLTAVAGASAAVVMLLPWANGHFALALFVNSNPLLRLPEFVLGVALALLVRHGAWRGPRLEASLAFALAGYFLSREIPGGYGYAACTVIGFSCLIAAAAVADATGAPSMWRRAWLVRLGELSFAFYMVHFLVIRCASFLLRGHAPLSGRAGLAVAVAVFSVALALSWILYERVELPGRRAIAGRSPRRREPAAAPAR